MTEIHGFFWFIVKNMESPNCLPFVIETLSKMELMVKILNHVVIELYQSGQCTPNTEADHQPQSATIDGYRSCIKEMDQSIALEFLKYAVNTVIGNGDQTLANISMSLNKVTNDASDVSTPNMPVADSGYKDETVTVHSNSSIAPTSSEFRIYSAAIFPLNKIVFFGNFKGLSVSSNYSDEWIYQNMINSSQIATDNLLLSNETTIVLEKIYSFEKDEPSGEESIGNAADGVMKCQKPNSDRKKTNVNSTNRSGNIFLERNSCGIDVMNH